MNEETKKRLMIWGGGGLALLLLFFSFRSRNQTATITPVVSGDQSGVGTSGDDMSMYLAKFAQESQANMVDVVKAINESNAGVREDLKSQNQLIIEGLKSNQAATNNALQQMAGGMSNLFAKYDPQAFFGTLQGQIDGLQSQLGDLANFTARASAPSSAGTQNVSVAPPQTFYDPVNRQPTTGYNQAFQQERLQNFQDMAKQGFSTPLIQTGNPSTASSSSSSSSSMPVVQGTVVKVVGADGKVKYSA